MNSYIGITDFTNYSQVDGMRAVFEAYQAPDSERVLHVGVMMSYKTLHGIPTKWQNAFPPKESIASIFGSSRVYNCLHYADYDGEEEFWRSLVEAVSYGGPNIHALQLDMIWPEPEWIAHAIHTSRKYLEIILQIGANALEIVKNDPDLLVRKLENYDGVIHRVLLDKSMGRGLGMDAHGLLPFARAIRENFPDLGIGAAGGLGPGSVRLVEPFLEEFPDISIDAQSKLRPSGNALDLIAWNMASAYLREALELLENPPREIGTEPYLTGFLFAPTSSMWDDFGMDLKSRVKELLSNTHLMCLGTVDTNGVWVADVVFIYDEDFNIYWMSDPETRHSKNIISNNKVAGSITYSTKSKEPNFGIQFEGEAEQLEGVQFDLLVKHLAKRGYPVPDPSEAEKLLDGDQWYKLTPTKLCLIDEANFGYDRQDVI